MEFEVLKRSHIKRGIVIGVVVVFIISAIILNFTRAKYRSVSSVPIINSEINYKVPDLNMVSLYVANEEGVYEEADTIPSSGYTLNIEQSYCGRSNNGEIVKDDTVSIIYENGQVNVLGLTKKGTKCYLYFDIEDETSGEQILENYPTVLTRNDFSTIVKDATTGTIYYADTSKGRTFYFAGNPTDNWVQFAGFYWRIIRVNEDGSVRMIYQGTSANTTGANTQIQESTFSINSNTYKNNAYVGYMYALNAVHGLTTNSGIKRVLDTWYENNLQINYAQYLSKKAGFCGDRQPSTSSSTSNGQGGTGTTPTYYGAYIRLVNSSKNPTFDCQNSSDLYTVASSSQGNKALNYPIGLITADEVAYAGGVWNTVNSGYYLYTGRVYWTMSPSNFHTNGTAYVYYVNGNGSLNDDSVPTLINVRPVINLSPDVTITGSGTSTDPYTVVEA